MLKVLQRKCNRPIRNSYNPQGIWTFQFSCGQKSPPQGQNPHQGCRLCGQMPHLRKSDIFKWYLISVPALFQCQKQKHMMSVTLNISLQMITEGYGSFFNIWRQACTSFVCNCATKHKIEAPNQIPHPSGVVVKCPTPGKCEICQIPACPGKERQMHDHYHKMQQVLQSVMIITKSDNTYSPKIKTFPVAHKLICIASVSVILVPLPTERKMICKWTFRC